MNRPIIMVCNDDGYFAEGLQKLCEALTPLGRVVAVAPDQDNSGVSHKITINTALRIRQVGPDFFAVNGSPVDCVHLGVHGVLEGRLPDLMVSGINHGLNLGEDTTYSGTVSAAFEASTMTIPAIAISTGASGAGFSFENAKRVAYSMAKILLERRHFEEKAFWNVNVPGGQIKGVRVVRLDKRSFKSSVVKRIDPRGQPYYWLGPYNPRFDQSENTDYTAYHSGHVAITPIKIEMTDFETLETINRQDNPFHSILDQGGDGLDKAFSDKL